MYKHLIRGRYNKRYADYNITAMVNGCYTEFSQEYYFNKN